MIEQIASLLCDRRVFIMLKGKFHKYTCHSLSIKLVGQL